MNTKITKVLLALIAVALWAQLLMPVVRPVSVKADDDDSAKSLAKIADDLHLISTGNCGNTVICPLWRTPK